MKILGITDEFTTCDCCGKSNLKCTVALENEAGDTVYYGRTCAARAIYGSKSAKNVARVSHRAHAMVQIVEVRAVLVANADKGIDGAISAAREFIRAGISARKYRDHEPLVGGFASWGHWNIHHQGYSEKVYFSEAA